VKPVWKSEKPNVPRKVILHCSASSDENDNVCAKTIREDHVKNRGFDDIGYHFILIRQGLIETGRPLKVIGAHCKGHNTGSIGVCLVGDTLFTESQIRELLNLYVLIYKSWKIDWQEWYCHYTFNSNKTCPNLAQPILRRLLEDHHCKTLVEGR
jgi:hypothetical protein